MEKYESPTIEIIVFESVDIITNSDTLGPEIPADP